MVKQLCWEIIGNKHANYLIQKYLAKAAEL